MTRSLCRLLWQHGYAPLAEVPLADGRRADVMALGGRGEIWIVEVKVSLADLRGDRKWPFYRDWCDAFWWAAPEALAAELAQPAYAPHESGLILSDGHEAAMIREAPNSPLSPARRKAVTLALARTAAERAHRLADPGFERFPGH